jgi:rhodanese-related sulfurtransferase
MLQVKTKSISPNALSAILGSGNELELLDVRMPPEYAIAHVPGARLIPLNELRVEAFLAQHKPGTPVYVLCQSGARASKAIEQLESTGCDDCVLVEGGTQAWMDAGLPVHRGTSSALPLIRQVQISVGSLTAVGAILALAVSPWFAVLPLFLGCGLFYAGATGSCALMALMAKMPWNQIKVSCTNCCASE